MNTKNKMSLGYKTFFYFSVFSIGILLFLWSFEYVVIQILAPIHQMKIINEAKEQIKNADQDLLTTIENIAYEHNYCIELHTSNQIYSFNEKSKKCILNSKEVISIKRSLINSSKDELAKLENNIVQSIRVDKDTVVLIGAQNIRNSLRADILRSYIFYFSIILILVAFIVSYYVSRLLNKPILKITDSARSMAGGNFAQDQNDYGIKELNELRNVLNYARTEIENTDKLRRDLMANVSHDLKTPLTMIKAYAEMAKDLNGNNKKKREENLNIIISETDRLNSLVNDILDLSKLQNNIQVFNFEDYDLVKEIQEIIQKYQIIKEVENYNFIINAPKEAMVYADKKQINQVIYNLVNNAINYTGNDLQVKVNVKDEKDSYLVEVIDTGKGLTEEQINLIWNKYYKDEKNHKRYKTGTGLGLYIVQTILKGHNFEYGVTSKVDNGSRFFFYIKKSNLSKK